MSSKNANYQTVRHEDVLGSSQRNSLVEHSQINAPGTVGGAGVSASTGADTEHASQYAHVQSGGDDVVIHCLPEYSGKRWDHQTDLDTFFSNIYIYFHRQGFWNIAIAELGQILIIFGLIAFMALTSRCVDYKVLLGNREQRNLTVTHPTDVTLWSTFIPPSQCVQRFSILEIIMYAVFGLVICYRFYGLYLRFSKFADTRKFYNTILNIDDSDLSDTTWHEVLRRVRDAQLEHNMVIEKNDITELDVCHYILREQNFLVAMTHKGLLPDTINLPVLGEVVWLTDTHLLMIKWLLFRFPMSPFQLQSRTSLTVPSRSPSLDAMDRRFRRLIYSWALFTLIFSPLFVIYNCVYVLASYGDTLRGNVQRMTLRGWSLYGRLQMRHFNELDHELNARLNRALPHAERYCNSFSSPLLTTIAKICRVMAGAPLVYLIALTMLGDKFFEVPGILQLITIFGTIMIACNFLISDEKGVQSPQEEMTAMAAHLHYLPKEWRELSHTTKVRRAFEKLYESCFHKELKELLGPFLTPLQLVFVMAPRSRDIMKFFASFTIHVRGVGKVCSFAEMDVHKHGNPDWHVKTNTANATVTKIKDNMTDGRIELSLMHFALNNPDWKMPDNAADYIKTVRDQASKELITAKTAPSLSEADNPAVRSIMAFDAVEKEYRGIADSVMHLPITPEQAQAALPSSLALDRSMGASHVPSSMLTSSHYKKGLCQIEGSVDGPAETLLSRFADPETLGFRDPLSLTIADMNLSALYLHELHQKNLGKDNWPYSSGAQRRGRSLVSAVTPANYARPIIVSTKKAEKTPLLSPT